MLKYPTLMPRLQLPSDEFTMPVRCPNPVQPPFGNRAIIVQIHRHCSLLDFVYLFTMTDLKKNKKKRKPVDTLQVASHDPTRGTPR